MSRAASNAIAPGRGAVFCVARRFTADDEERGCNLARREVLRSVNFLARRRGSFRTTLDLFTP